MLKLDWAEPGDPPCYDYDSVRAEAARQAYLIWLSYPRARAGTYPALSRRGLSRGA
jgi:hypothetical protein